MYIFNPTALFNLKRIAVVAVSVFLVGCGTLTGIPSHGGGKRFAIEQRLVSTTIRGAIKEIDLTALRGKTVFLQITSINDQGAGNMIGGRASLIFALQGATESSPVSSVRNTFKVFDLSSSGGTTTTQATVGGSSGTSSSFNNISDSSSSTTVTNVSADSSNTSTSSGSGTNDTVTTVDSTDVTTGSGTVDTTGTTDTTTTTGTVVTTQDGMNASDTDTTNTSTTDTDGTTTTDGKNTSTSTTTGSNTQNSSSTTRNDSNSSRSSVGGGQSNNRNFQNSTLTSSNNNSQQVLANQAEETRTQTKGSSYRGNYGVDYRGQGTYSNFNVPVSDVGILQSIVREYFYLNDVIVTTDPNNPAIEALVNINVDVFGSIRSRLDTVVYNQESVKVQTVLEVMAIDYRDKTLMMVPQTGSYEAIYQEKYAFWIGPLNTNSKRIKHHSMTDPMLVSFADVALAKQERDRLAAARNPTPYTQSTSQLQRPSGELTELVNIKKTLSSWLRAWEDSDVAGYLELYSPAFVPHKGLSVALWKRKRTDKLTANQNIKINLKNVKILIAPDQVHAKATFLQEYRSTNYQDDSIKTLKLEKVAGKWRIISEQS